MLSRLKSQLDKLFTPLPPQTEADWEKCRKILKMRSQKELGKPVIPRPETSVVSVVIGSYNRRYFLEKAIESVRNNQIRVPYEIIVIDGGSTDGALEWLTTQKDIITIVQHNRGEFRGKEIQRRSWGYFMNLGFKIAQGKYILMISDDCLVLPNAINLGLDKFAEMEKANRKVGGVAFYFRNWPIEKDYYVQKSLGGKLAINHGLYLKEALAEVGWVEEKQYIFYKADSDLCLKMWLDGYEIVDCPGAFVEHYYDPEEEVRQSNNAVLDYDRQIYLKRWQNIYYYPHWQELRGKIELSYQDPEQTASENWQTTKMNQPELAIVLGTYNRLELLQKAVNSILEQTSVKFKLYITDAGSTDGTIPYLESIASETIIPIFSGEKLGQAKAYNDVFTQVDTPYVCWLSDDNVIVNNGLDLGVSILKSNPNLGMVGLKTKDLQGPFTDSPYIGGVSSIGILNVNQGMLRTEVLKQVGGFSEEFRDYGIDPDLTTKVLLAGYDVAYTKAIAIHHYRNWGPEENSPEYQQMLEKQVKYKQLYQETYGEYLQPSWVWQTKKLLWLFLRRGLGMQKYFNSDQPFLLESIPRDWHNIFTSRYISVFDVWRCQDKPYHLIQHCPPHLRPQSLKLTSL